MIGEHAPCHAIKPQPRVAAVWDIAQPPPAGQECLGDDVCSVVGVVRAAQHVSGDRGVVRGVYLLEPAPPRLRGAGERRSHGCSPRHQSHVRMGRKHFKINTATEEAQDHTGRTPSHLGYQGD
jgi:hypothetical protein